LYATDLNQIPASLIERVEILTGGASAVYGSDAVAGVVNFIMKTNFSGVQGEVNYSFFNHQQHNSLADVIAGRATSNPAQFKVPGDVSRDGDSTNVNLLMGGNFSEGRGNATVFFSYQKDYAVLQRDRDYSACSTGVSADGTAFTCAGSSTSFPGRFLNALTGASSTIADAAGNVRAFNGNLDQFNFAPYNYYQRPDERYGFAASAHYDINPHVRAYSEFNFHDDHTQAQIAPSGIFFGFEGFPTADNPLLSTSFRNAFGITATTPGDILIGRRNIEGGGRVDDLRHTSFRTVIGVKGDILKNWDYDVYMQTGKVLMQEVYLNDFSKIRIARALDVVTGPGGTPVCRSVVDGTDTNCVPYDIFHLGGVTQAALNYLQTPGFQRGSTEQMVQGATLSTDLGNYGYKVPGTKSGIGMAVGVERRTEKLNLDTDLEFSTFDLAGQGGPVIGRNGKYTVKEVFGELRVPILEGAPMAELLSVNGSYRYSDYSTDKTTNSYGLGIEYAPIKAVKVRASYQQAVRAANIIELFQAQGLNLFGLAADPCGGPTPSATLAQCQRTGLPTALYGNALLTNPAGQYNYLQGGNPDLNPETAKTYTLGLVLQPMRNVSATVDYFHIKVKDQISTLGAAVALQQCIATGQFCNLIHRDTFGTLWLGGAVPGFVTDTNQNIGSQTTSGVDFSVNYNHNLQRWGGLAFTFSGTWLKEFITEPSPGLGDYDCTGLYGNICGTPLPKWRHKARVTWSTPWAMDVALTWRHFDKVSLDSTSSNPFLAGDVAPITAELGRRDYIDIAGTWAFSKNLTVRAGVNNVFDKDPPITNSSIADPSVFGNGNTWPGTYDALGRKIFASVTVNF
jgi:iron complex outermembrane recepter protein